MILLRMGRRTKQSSSDLRCVPIHLFLHKYNLSTLTQTAQTHWNISNMQPYFPPIEKMFKSSDLESICEYGIKFNNQITEILGEDKIKTTSEKDVHVKTTMLFSSHKWMCGEYGSVLGLPTSNEHADLNKQKLQSPNNAAYVGALISTLLSESKCVNFPEVYGVFTGIKAEHMVDISDDYEALSEEKWFSQNLGKMFNIKLSNDNSEQTFSHTRKSRPSMHVGESVELENVVEIETTPLENIQAGELSKVMNHSDVDEDNLSDCSSISTSYIFDVHSCICSEDSDEEDEDYEPFAWAIFNNVPVQLTVMEKCEGTLYELMMLNPDSEKHLAWVAQVMFALAYAQRIIGLTHNDLHANNVMYVKTTEEYLFYNCGGILYKVPTFGYIIKIIDFERGIASVKLAGMKAAKTFMSDHFSMEEEAGGQYNYGDFYNTKYPEIKPCASFDLCRLATSLFFDLFPLDEVEEHKDDLLYKLFTKWLTLEDGTSFLLGKKDPNHERYHGFHLYKAITRYAKDNAVPRKEVMALKQYQVSLVDEGKYVLLIEP